MSHKSQMIQVSMIDLTAALIKQQNVTAGWWRMYFRFALTATNVNFQGHMYPAAMVPITEVGLMREADERHSILAVDASVVNPTSRIVIPAGGKFQ